MTPACGWWPYPFGRFATFDYDSMGRLTRITDVIGLVSEFTYAGAGDFIAALTTPYGTTSFSRGENGNNRWVELVDPLGGRERLEYLNYSLGLFPTDPPSAYPPGYWGYNIGDTVTVYWDKRAMALAPGDYSKARIIHWMRKDNFNQATGTRSHEKLPLENRLWYSYAGQTSASGHRYVGTTNQPIEMARVLDDGTAQVTRFEYNSRSRTSQAPAVGTSRPATPTTPKHNHV